MFKRSAALLVVLTVLGSMMSVASCSRDAYTKRTEEPEMSDTETAESSGTSDTSDAGIVPLPDTDDLLFVITRTNMAWGYQSDAVLITCRGDMYSYEDISGPVASYREVFAYLREYAEPEGHLDLNRLTEFYNACIPVPADVKVDSRSTGNDIGQARLIFIDQETGEEITIINRGDWTMTTDDPDLLNAQEVCETLMHTFPNNDEDYRILMPGNEMFNMPYGGTDLIGTHMIFTSYDDFISFCGENGMDPEEFMDDNTLFAMQRSPCIALQIFDTNDMAGAVLERNENTLEFMISLEPQEENPLFEGKVTAAVSCHRFPIYEHGYVDENGNPWTVYSR